ncbi:MAG: hypothetical protein KDD43_16745, partial [Bdellovibrionales bacterium]|nr:hypothetical protein [Bdellovibrionales bacterium]
MLIGCILWLLGSTALALSVNAVKGGVLSLEPMVEYFEDSARNLTLSSLLAQQDSLDWQIPSNNSLNKGYNQNPFWIRFRLRNEDTDSLHRLLEIAYPQLDHVTFYELGESGVINEIHTGDAQPFLQRPIEHPNFVFPLTLPPQSDITVLLRVQTTGTLSVPLTLWENNTFFIHSGKVEQIHAIYYGILTVIIIFNLFVFLALRESTYLYYSLSTLGYLALLSVLRGKTFQVLWPDHPEIHRLSMLVAIPFVLIFSVLFARSFLNLHRSSPKLDRVFQMVLGLACLALLGAFLLPYQYSVQSSVLLAIPTCSLLLVIGPIEWAKGNRPARFYSLAWAMLTFGATIAA